ncbi:MAG: hypothetical protein GF398_05980 [Chitinivibrionales bacterium]|nr:hypothetical protein [Chitinivibrionales bacterium]
MPIHCAVNALCHYAAAAGRWQAHQPVNPGGGCVPVLDMHPECINHIFPCRAPEVAGNYAAGMWPDIEAKKKGYPIALYLNASRHKCIDEFGTSNFIGITPDRKYITPSSSSILRSITNKSLQDLAREMGLTVECRSIPFTQCKHFVEVGACGTAAIITPIYSLTTERLLTHLAPRIRRERCCRACIRGFLRSSTVRLMTRSVGWTLFETFPGRYPGSSANWFRCPARSTFHNHPVELDILCTVPGQIRLPVDDIRQNGVCQGPDVEIIACQSFLHGFAGIVEAGYR